MGLCLPCLGGAADDVVETPDPVSRGSSDPDLKRRQLAEAAEKRQMEAASRGIKNPMSVEQKKKKSQEVDNMAGHSGGGGGGGLRWQVG
ncbi:small VCP/p97-interacting protein isoform X4 [Hyla sarda]|uniref:small VCP/p97-interacting protein isoform X4 n=1 Tax=Hyla sarda TaxID=327740 RepID=UPI0024C417D6|nr:small VCP/p97-interacting protein isoform X4 [Hyla sarda]